MNITVSLSNIQAARDQLNECEDWILEKTRELAKAVAEAGLEIAENNTGDYANYIKFEIHQDETPTGGIAILTMSDKQKVLRQWRYRGGHKDAEVSPSLMAEYGSGKFAVEGWRGTFPDQKHAWEDSWSWVSYPDNVFHRSSGEKPTRPIYTAYTRLQDAGLIREIAERVFV